MRTLLMHTITAAACGAALLAFGVASAGEDEAVSAQFVVIDTNVRIPATRNVTSYEVVDARHILLKAGVRRLYLAELSGACARNARWDHQIVLDTQGVGGVDRFSQLWIDGRRCQIESLAEVERTAAAPS